MIDLSELIDDPDFSQVANFKLVSNTENDSGLPKEETRDFSCPAIIQPADNGTLQRLPENERYKPSVRIFTHEALFAGDYLIYQGFTWRIIADAVWADYGYYDTTAIQYGGTEDINKPSPEFT